MQSDTNRTVTPRAGAFVENKRQIGPTRKIIKQQANSTLNYQKPATAVNAYRFCNVRAHCTRRGIMHRPKSAKLSASAVSQKKLINSTEADHRAFLPLLRLYKLVRNSSKGELRAAGSVSCGCPPLAIAFNSLNCFYKAQLITRR